MTPQEVEERIAAARSGAAEGASVRATLCVSAVHDAVVVEIECDDCGPHAVMVCPDCGDDDPEAVHEECPQAAALLGALGAGRVIA